MGNRKIFDAIRWITTRPSANILIGVIFIVSGAYETYEIMVTELEGPTIGSHHGAMIFGIYHVLKHMPDFFEGLIFFKESREE